VLFDRSLFAELMEVKGDQGGRQVIAEHGDELEEMEVGTEAIFTDIDTADDYRTADPSTGLRAGLQPPTFSEWPSPSGGRKCACCPCSAQPRSHPPL
jgi:hypothetical protein